MHTNITVALNEFLVVVCCIFLNMQFLQLVLRIKFFIIKTHADFLEYFWYKLLPSSLYAMLKLSKTTSHKKLPHLIESHCIIGPGTGLDDVVREVPAAVVHHPEKGVSEI